jgi:hypothetical protein
MLNFVEEKLEKVCGTSQGDSSTFSGTMLHIYILHIVGPEPTSIPLPQSSVVPDFRPVANMPW